MFDSTISVSVVMPVYNTGQFLRSAIESVLNQRDISVELILINDGSTDNSRVVCNDFVTMDSRVRYFEQTNLGVSAARNNGFSRVKGQFVFFMDSDDTIADDFLSLAFLKAEDNSSDIVVLDEYYCNRVEKGVLILPTCAQLIKVSFLNENSDVRFPVGIQPCEDGLFSFQLFALTDKVSLSPESRYFYRQHSAQNHVNVSRQKNLVLQQIPLWFSILKKFYTDKSLFNSHGLHLALFVEHEPFEFRYQQMQLNDVEKGQLHQLITIFFNETVRPYLKDDDWKSLTDIFILFVNSDSSTEFQERKKRYYMRRKWFRRFVKLIPITSWRRKIRRQIG